MDLGDVDELESDVLDGLDEADDGEIPGGVRSLSAARRERALAATVRLLGGR
jgi:hypothetical protein